MFRLPSLLLIVLVMLVVLFADISRAEARCGGRGLFRGRQPIRHILHRVLHPLHRR